MPLDRSHLKRTSIHDRLSKVDLDLSAGLVQPGRTHAEFLDSLPRVLQANALLELIEAVATAKRNGKPILLLYGAHIVKTGLAPLFSQALESGWVTHAATNGAGTIHDLELACFGRTSEDVADSLRDGSFGMALETGVDWNRAVNEGREQGLGLGDAIGRWIDRTRAAKAKGSILAAASRLGRPVTAHVALGTDVTHMHPEADGAAIGETSFRDFETLCERVADLHDGGVVLNVGSAVILPEVFLKALSVARNLRGPVDSFTAANLDMNRHYRPSENILARPTRPNGRALEIIGPHEILLPLLFQGVCDRLARGD